MDPESLLTAEELGTVCDEFIAFCEYYAYDYSLQNNKLDLIFDFLNEARYVDENSWRDTEDPLPIDPVLDKCLGSECARHQIWEKLIKPHIEKRKTICGICKEPLDCVPEADTPSYISKEEMEKTDLKHSGDIQCSSCLSYYSTKCISQNLPNGELMPCFLCKNAFMRIKK